MCRRICGRSLSRECLGTHQQTCEECADQTTRVLRMNLLMPRCKRSSKRVSHEEFAEKFVRSTELSISCPRASVRTRGRGENRRDLAREIVVGCRIKIKFKVAASLGGRSKLGHRCDVAVGESHDHRRR